METLFFKFEHFAICLFFLFLGLFLLVPLATATAFEPLLLHFGFLVFLWWALEGVPSLLRVFWVAVFNWLGGRLTIFLILSSLADI
jgi:hypothetical protein